MPNESQNFWNFSLDLYSREGVAAACLALQSDYQLDVNLILFCYWYGNYFGEVDEQLLADAVEFSAKWRHHVVQPLRDSRNWMKLNADRNDGFDKLRERIKADELAAEKYQQERIAALVHETSGAERDDAGSIASARNMDKLLQAMQLRRDAKIEASLLTISCALEQESLAAR